MDTPKTLDIAYSDPGGVGYHPVLYMVRLAARLLDGNIRILHGSHLTPIDKVLGLALERRRTGDRKCLLICPSPADLNALLTLDNWRTAYAKVVVWVFDSFWLEYIPRLARIRRQFDHVFVTEPEDLDAWRKITRTDVTCLPWGSDVLSLGSSNSNRSTDVLRVGRQPKTWEDDSATAAAFTRKGMTFRGRPPCLDDAEKNERELMRSFADTKFTLSFTNRVSPSHQTHPHREYFTGRWTDAVASGAVVAGVPPRTVNADTLFWPGALLPLESVDLDEGVEAITRAARAWTPAVAETNYVNSLSRLDWRWRFQVLAEALDIHPTELDVEIAELRRLQQSRALAAMPKS